MHIDFIIMTDVEIYINEVLGLKAEIENAPATELVNLPLYIREGYNISFMDLIDHKLILAKQKEEGYNIAQIQKHLEILQRQFKKEVVLLSYHVDALHRKRLIQKQIDFIVPGKQLYLPHLLIDLREYGYRKKNKKTQQNLLPSAQCLLLFHLLPNDKKIKLSELSFKELAQELKYTQTAITKAAENLHAMELCDVKGTKEKYIHFKLDRHDLWATAKQYLGTPVLKKVFIDFKPDLFLLKSNVSALPEYSDLNPPKEKYFAIDKTTYYELYKNKAFVNENEKEGAICLEVWKYNPRVLNNCIEFEDSVDPLSLFLSLKDVDDARIEIALQQIIDNFRW